MSETRYIYGMHAVSALLKNPTSSVLQIYVVQEKQNKRVQELLLLAKDKKIRIEELPPLLFDKRFAGWVHQGVVASIKGSLSLSEQDIPSLMESSKNLLILILDGVTDPHNLGACLRTADAAGVNFVIVPKDKSAGLTPVVSKVACGAAESIPLLFVTNLARVLEKLKQHGVWIYGAAAEANQTLYTFDLKGHVAFVMGSEGSGLRRLTRECCDDLFALPLLGQVESLNVSVATGICLYEALRQRHHK